jgi:putative phosphoesterase
MKYLVVSDNHGDRDILVELKEMYKHQVDRMFHCGDSELEPTDSLWQDFIVVRGNCDYSADFPNKIVDKTTEDIIFMTHGHLANVRYGLTTLALQAAEAQANIALFGHTHEIGCEMNEGVLFLNPGSIRLPRGPIQIKSYVMIDSHPEALEIQYYGRDHQPIKELHFIYPRQA